MMEKILNPTRPVRCIITGPSECGNSIFLTNLILYNNNDYDKIYIYSPSRHQGSYQKRFKCPSNYIPINIMSKILDEEDVNIVIE